ncbi:MAG: ATP-binding protein [Hyphomonadaceae bacterium]
MRNVVGACAARLAAEWRQLKIASKLNIALVALGAIGFLLVGLVLNASIRPAFERLEREALQQQVGRAETLLQGALTAVESNSLDYAVWDDSYEYMRTADPAFEAETATVLALVNLGVNARAYVTFEGEALHAIYADIEAEEEQAQRAAVFERLVTSDAMVALAQRAPSFSTYVVLDGRVLAVGGAQIHRSDGSGEPRGFIVTATELGDAAASEALQTSVTVAPVAASSSMTPSPDAWRVVAPIAGADGAPVAHLAFDMPRDVYQLGASTIMNTLVFSALVLLAALVWVFLMVRAMVVRRLTAIDAHMHRVAADGALAPLPEDANADEVGSLARSFNAMMSELAALRERLEVQSFELGKSESAAGALHNVKNSLTPVGAIISKALSLQSSAKVEDVEKAIAELASAETAPVRRTQLSMFLRVAVQDVLKHAVARRDALLTAKDSLAEALAILRTQNGAAQKQIPVETFDIAEVIAANAAAARFAPWGEVDLVLPARGVMVRANRLLCSQVVGNLLTNAIESIAAAGRRPGRIAVSVASAGDKIAVTVCDDGAGFDPALAVKLFERGFSTKPGHSSGLGLHWCANTVNAMGGALTLSSAGPGQGASATLTLPGAAAGAQAPAHERAA